MMAGSSLRMMVGMYSALGTLEEMSCGQQGRHSGPWPSWSPSTPPPPLSSSCTGPHHDLGWHEALSVAGYGLQALLSLPVQVLESLAQGAVGALQVTTWRAERATRLRTICSTRPGCNPRDGQGTEPASHVPEGPPGQQENQGG